MSNSQRPDGPGFVYVATCNELIDQGISKIGVTRNIRARLAAHRRNSSQPLELFCFQCFRFELFSEARRIETWVKRELRKLGCDFRGGKEFYEICPSNLCEAIRDACEALSLSAIEEFPYDIEQIFNKGGDFVSLPIELLECLTQGEALAYWHGVKDTLSVLAGLEGVCIRRTDFRQLRSDFRINIDHNEPTTASTIIDFFRNHSCKEYRSIAEEALREKRDAETGSFSKVPGEWLLVDWRSRHSEARR